MLQRQLIITSYSSLFVRQVPDPFQTQAENESWEHKFKTIKLC